MSKMLDRMAEAIWLESVAEDDDCDSFGEFEFLRAREKFRNLARAALKVMVEPTEEMKFPAMDAFMAARAPRVDSERNLSREKMSDDPKGGSFCAGVALGYGAGKVEELFAVYRAMICAILKDDSKKITDIGGRG